MGSLFPDQGSNLRPLRWKADSLPLDHRGSPNGWVFTRHTLGSCFLVASPFWFPTLSFETDFSVMMCHRRGEYKKTTCEPAGHRGSGKNPIREEKQVGTGLRGSGQLLPIPHLPATPCRKPAFRGSETYCAFMFPTSLPPATSSSFLYLKMSRLP